MSLENYSRRFHLKEASQRLINPLKSVVSESMKKLEDGIYDNFGRKRIALINNATNRLYLISDVVSKRKEALDYGLFVEGIQLDMQGMPKKGLLPIQLPVDPNLVDKSSSFLLRGIDPRDMLKLAKEIGVAKMVELHVYASYLTILRKKLISQT